MTDPQAAHDITTETALRALFPPTHDLALQKVLDHLDRHARDFIARSPFLCIGSQNETGAADVSPRGDPPGFVKVLADKTLLIPDRPGNNRLDALSNIIAHPAVGLLFLIPGFDDTMRINGRARISTDPALLKRCRLNDRDPRVVIIVEVDEVFIHCAKALRRAGLWDSAQHQDRATFPSLMQVIHDQTGGAPLTKSELAAKDAALEADYRTSMY